MKDEFSAVFDSECWVALPDGVERGTERVTDEAEVIVQEGAVPLATAIGGLRDELMRALWAGQFSYEINGQHRWLRFKPSAVEVELQVAVTWAGTAKAGVKWWLVEAGGELGREKVATQTVKVVLEPLLFDEAGRSIELLVDAAEDPEPRSDDDDEVLLG